MGCFGKAVTNWGMWSASLYSALARRTWNTVSSSVLTNTKDTLVCWGESSEGPGKRFRAWNLEYLPYRDRDLWDCLASRREGSRYLISVYRVLVGWKRQTEGEGNLFSGKWKQDRRQWAQNKIHEDACRLKKRWPNFGTMSHGFLIFLGGAQKLIGGGPEQCDIAGPAWSSGVGLHKSWIWSHQFCDAVTNTFPYFLHMGIEPLYQTHLFGCWEWDSIKYYKYIQICHLYEFNWILN